MEIETRQKIEDYVKEARWTPKDYYWKHAFQARDLALMIQEKVGGDRDIVEVAALLHDVGKAKLLSLGHEEISAELTEKLLKKVNFPKEKISQVLECVKYESFGILEAKILRSADSMSLILDKSGGKEWYFENVLCGDKQKIFEELEKSYSEIEFDFAKDFVKETYQELLWQYR